MSVITEVIPPQSFEVVRDRIGRILADEILNQYTTSGNHDLNALNWIERFIPFDNTELPSVNVMLAEGTYSGQTVVQVDGTYRYYIDCYVNAKTDALTPGDSKAMSKLHRLMGVCRAIIEDARYKTLGFATPDGFIMNRHIESIQFREPNQKEHDMMSSAMGRIILSVKMPEYPGGFVQPTNATSFRTTVKLNGTEKGYMWFRENAYDPYDFALDT